MSSRAKPKTQPAPPPPVVEACEPLKPRRGLFVGLLLGFVAWVGVLLGLYFKTVYPERHPSAGTTTQSPRP